MRIGPIAAGVSAAADLVNMTGGVALVKLPSMIAARYTGSSYTSESRVKAAGPFIIAAAALCTPCRIHHVPSKLL